MADIHILWVDDEIDLLRSHIIFLESKGYKVTTANSGHDALALCKKDTYDIAFLDENMPGLSGLETLSEIKKMQPALPVIMITKSEEEDIMEQAIGKKIADYLIKPVNPNQIVMAIKKILQSKQLISDKVTSSYQSAFTQIGIEINDTYTFEDWKKVYKHLVYWELELEHADNQMDSLLMMQKNEANANFTKYIRKNYTSWFEPNDDKPLMSPDIFKNKIFPLLDKGEKVCFVVIDNLRFDQWKVLQKELSEWFYTSDDDLYCGILPTATQYARNAIFAGLMPLQIQKMFPQYWIEEEDEEGKNMKEEELLQTQLDRFRKKYSFSYHKINTSQAGEKLNEQLHQYLANDLNVVVFNFIDMLSHVRTESKIFRELVPDEAAYRSLILSWFKHSSTNDFFKILAEKGIKVVLTTDHGTIRAKNPIKVVGDKNTNSNLRYKVGKNLSYNKKDVFPITQPELIGLPSPNISSHYIFATQEDFFAYPNNYNYYVSYYKDTFQHGGISLEEMLIPIAVLEPKRK
jgi:DNA-binding response OmpR family regulator